MYQQTRGMTIKDAYRCHCQPRALSQFLVRQFAQPSGSAGCGLTQVRMYRRHCSTFSRFGPQAARTSHERLRTGYPRMRQQTLDAHLWEACLYVLKGCARVDDPLGTRHKRAHGPRSTERLDNVPNIPHESLSAE